MGNAPEDAAAGNPAGGPVRRARKTNPLATRIKRLMQTDEDVGKIAQAAPALIGRALELFLGRLCNGANAVAQQHYANQLSAGHLKAAVAADPTLDFLTDTVSEAPDLPPPPEKPPVRRQRKKEDAAGEGREAEAAPSRQRKPRAHKRKAASDNDSDEDDAAAAEEGSDPDYSDDSGAGKKRQRKRKAAPRKPRGPKPARAGGGRAVGGRRAAAERRAEPDVELSDTGEDVAVGWVPAGAVAGGGPQQRVSTAAPLETTEARVQHADAHSPLPVRQSAAAVGGVALQGAAAAAPARDATSGPEPAAALPGAQHASVPAAAGGSIGEARLTEHGAVVPAAVASLPAGVMLPSLAAVLPVEEDDYDVE